MDKVDNASEKYSTFATRIATKYKENDKAGKMEFDPIVFDMRQQVNPNLNKLTRVPFTCATKLFM